VGEGSRRSSFHSTLNSLIGMLDHEILTGGSPALREARRHGEEYLFQRGLMRSLGTGKVHAPWATYFAYPYRWFYSVLRAADYFREASLHDDRRPDDRMAAAIELIHAARVADGTWHQQLVHDGRTWFDVDSGPGEASQWPTFHALRVLAWWDVQPSALRAAGQEDVPIDRPIPQR